MSRSRAVGTGWCRVLVAACSDEVTEACCRALWGDGFAVARERSAGALEAAAQRFRPHLVVLDTTYPDGTDGVAVARRLRAGSDVALLFVANDVEHLLRAYDAGADDFMVRPVDPAELVVRARAVLRRTGSASSPVWQVGDVVVDEGAHEVLRNGQPIDLTPLEFGILARLARTPGRVVSKEQLLNEVWSYDVFDVNIVEVHVSLLRKKLEEVGPRVVHTVRGVGYVVRAPEALAAVGASTPEVAVP